MEFRDSKTEGVVLLDLTGRLDADSSLPLQRRVQLLADQGETQFVVNAKALTYMSSTGMRLFLELAGQVRPNGGHVVLCALQEPVRRILKMSGLSTKFDISETCADGIKRCQAGL